MANDSSAQRSPAAADSAVVDLGRVRVAANRIAPFVQRTPVLTSESIDNLSAHQVFLKCESLQRTGSFKLRGAMNAMANLGSEIEAHGVLTASSGNFALALAWAARCRGVAAHVVMPADVPRVKRASAEAFGAVIYTCEPTLADRERVCMIVAEETDAIFVSPHDHPDVIAGHGTIALELLDQMPEIDAIVAPVGGGGLVSGLAITAKALKPDVQVIGAEPSGAADAARSKRAGYLVVESDPHTVAEGLRIGLGEMTWPIVRDLVDEVMLVDDEATLHAMRLVWDRMKVIIEPSAAVAVAAILSPEFRSRADISRVAVVLSGGNVDLDALPW